MDVHFTSMCNRKDLDYFLRQIQKMRTGENFHIDMESEFFSAPEVVAPCAGLIELLKSNGHAVKVDYVHNALSNSGLDNPYTIKKMNMIFYRQCSRFGDIVRVLKQRNLYRHLLNTLIRRSNAQKVWWNLLNGQQMRLWIMFCNIPNLNLVMSCAH